MKEGDIKHISVTSRRHPFFTPDEGNLQNDVLVHNKQENWSLTVVCQEDNRHTDRELAQIQFKFPNGRLLTCTILDLQSLEAILYNAANHMKDFAGIPMTDKQEESSILDSCSELAHALSMFKK